MIFKYALKNISRSMVRNILISIIIIVISAATCVSLFIQNASDVAKSEAMEGMTVSGHIYVDRQYMMENMSQDGSTDFREMLKELSGLTIDEMQEYAAADSVDDFYYTASVSLNGNGDVEALNAESSTVATTDSEETSDAVSEAISETVDVQMPEDGQMMPPDGQAPDQMMGGQQSPDQMMMGGQQDPQQMMEAMVNRGDFTLIGYSSDSAMTDFTDGTCYLQDGEMFPENTSEYLCIINTELASYNSIGVGDKITLVNPNNEEESYEFTIVGTYKNTAMDASSVNSASNDPANQILTSYEVVDAIVDASAEIDEDAAIMSSSTGTYVFNSIAHFDAFETEAREMGLEDKYAIISNDVATFEQSLVPLENLQSFSFTFMMIILAIGALVLITVSIITIRDRKYEIGAMAAMGLKKHKISAMFITEMLVVTLLATVIGSVIGFSAATPVTNNLLATQVEQQESTDSQVSSNFGRDTSAVRPHGGDIEGEVTYMSTVNTGVSTSSVLMILGIGVGLALLSSASSVLVILRYDPKQILSNRD